MKVSNERWVLEEADDGYLLVHIGSEQSLWVPTLEDVRALAAIAESTGSRPTGGISASVGISEKLEVKKYE